ncbi:hypothetical protein ACFSRY_00850 [Pontibacter locisalis]|uniref:Lipoprotein n=1 Tax=Pontibacter locisalis TaxID=1719035 RepID=A0ABW5IG76_9BACT
MMKNNSLYPYLLLLAFTLLSCQQKTEEDGSIAGTHPELEEQLEESQIETPVSDRDREDLYQRYEITMEEYQQNSSYDAGDIYRGRLAPLDESSHIDAGTYRSALQQGMKEGINFAGRYTVVSVGCGTNCQLHYVINRENGKVMDKLQSSIGAKYSPDSRLFIINPPNASINYEECLDCAPEAYVFEEGKFSKVSEL